MQCSQKKIFNKKSIDKPEIIAYNLREDKRKGNKKMTEKERFVAIHQKRGYNVETLGKMVILHLDNYTAYWFFNEDGTRDRSKQPAWWLA